MISRILFRLWLASSAAWLALVYGLVALTGDPVPTAMDAAVIWGIPAAVFIFGAALVWAFRRVRFTPVSTTPPALT